MGNNDDVKRKEEIIDNWFKDYNAKLKMDIEKEEKMFSDTEYFEWLIQYMKDKDVITNHDFICCPDYEGEEKEKVENIGVLFEGISDYCSNNYVYPTEYNIGQFYKVKLNNNGLLIGYQIGIGAPYWIRKAEITSDDNFLDFNDIINNKKQDNVNIIDIHLDYLYNMIMMAYENGVPSEALKEMLNNTIEELDDLNEGSYYTRKLK